jgi:hypothetical protein
MSEPEVGAETSADLSIEDELTQAFGAETSAGGESPTAGAAQSGSSPAPVSGSQSSPSGGLEAPKHWSEADRGLFGKAPPEIQKRWIDREAELQRGYDAKFQEIANFRREREQLDELLGPYARDLELNGISRTQFLQSLIGGHKYLQESPREALLWLAQAYGVDPKSLLQSQEGTDPRYAKISEELNQVRNQFQGFMTQAQQAAHAEKLSRVQGFAEAKGEDGKPAHPYFDEVSEDILRLMRATPGLDLEVAYNKALRMNDEVWEKLQAERALNAQSAKDRERKQTIDKARRAAAGNETGQATGTTRPKTLEQDLREGFANWNPD